MDFKNWLFNEMPISKFELLGKDKKGQSNWEPTAKRAYGFSKQDTGILTNPRAIEKIHKSWANSKNNFDFYFLRSAKAYLHREVGEVTPEWVKENLEIDIQSNEDAITVIFTNNTGAEKIALTGWVMGHRLGHAIRKGKEFETYFTNELNRDFKEILKEVYNVDIGSIEIQNRNRYYDGGYNKPQNTDKYLKALAYAIGTMRSVRQWNLRNFNEFHYELIAQYVTTGKIKFNPLPKSLTLDKKMAWGRPNSSMEYSRLDHNGLQEWNEILDGHAGKYEHYLDSIFNGLEGKIYVM